MIIQDDRTEEQKRTHCYLIVATDKVLSGWREPGNTPSFAAWAYRDGYESQVRGWVAARYDLKRIRQVVDNGTMDRYRPKGPGHLHIYVWKG